MAYPLLTGMSNAIPVEVREHRYRPTYRASRLHFRVTGPLAVIELKSTTLEYKIMRDHSEFHHGPIQSLLEVVARDPLYIAADKAYPDRRQHVAIHWLDAHSFRGPYAIILVTEEIDNGVWDVVTAFVSRRLPKVDTSTGGFLYAKA